MLATTRWWRARAAPATWANAAPDHQDPGATSTYYLFESAAEALAG